MQQPFEMFLRPLEFALNRALALDPDSQSRLYALRGKRLAVDLTDLELSVAADFDAEGVRLAPYEHGAHAHVKATSTALLAYAARRGEGSAEVEFRGDVGVVQAVRQLLGRLEIDFEEQLARVTGDVLAHQIGNAVRGFTGWLTRSRRSLELNLGEFLTEESRHLPTRSEVDGFLADVEQLRQAADRLEARIKLLERR